MADYYVALAADGGNNANNGLAPTDEGGGVGPKEYLQNVLDLISAGGTHTINFQPGLYPIVKTGVNYINIDTTNTNANITIQPFVTDSTVEIQTSSDDGLGFVNMSGVEGNLTLQFNDMILSTPAVTNFGGIVKDSSATSLATSSVSFTDCTINIPSAGLTRYALLQIRETSAVTPTREFSFTNCVISGGNGLNIIRDIAKLTMTGGSYNNQNSSAGADFPLLFDIGSVEIVGVDINIYKNFIRTWSSNSDPDTWIYGCDSILLKNNTLASGGHLISSLGNVDRIVCDGNTVVATKISDPEEPIIELGLVGRNEYPAGFTATPPSVDPYDISSILVCNNDLTWIGAVGATGDCIRIDTGADGAEVISNICSTNKGALAISASYVKYTDNILIGEQPCSVQGGSFNYGSNNTEISNDNADSIAYIWTKLALKDDFGGGNANADVPSDYNTCINSILVGTGANGRCFADLATVKNSGKQFNDYNCLWQDGGTVMGRVESTDVDNLTETVAAWLTLNVRVHGNDEHSLEVDPGLNADYKPTNSEVINGGKPDAKDNDTSMGAVGATAGGKGRYSGGGRYS